MNSFSRNSSVSSSTSARPSPSSRPNSPPAFKMTSASSSSLPKSENPSYRTTTKPKPKVASGGGGTKMKHQTISVSDLFGNNHKRSSASPRPSVITTTTTTASGNVVTSAYVAQASTSASYSHSNHSNNSNFSSALSNASSSSSRDPPQSQAAQPQPSKPPKVVRDFSPAVSVASVTAPTIPRIKLRLGPISASSTPKTTPPLATPPIASSSTSGYLASTSTLPKAPIPSFTKKKRQPELPTFVSAADTLLTAGTSTRPNVHRVVGPSVPPSPTAPSASAIKKAKAAMKGKGKASPNSFPAATAVASHAKGKGKGKGRARDELSPAPPSPVKSSAILYSYNEPSTFTSLQSPSQTPVAAKPPVASASSAPSARPTISTERLKLDLFGDSDSDGSLTSLPSEFQSSDSLSSEEGFDSDGQPDVLFISSSKRRASQALSSSEDNSEMESDSDSGTFSSTTNGMDDDMEDDDEMLLEEEDFVRRDERSRRGGGGGHGGGGRRKGGWENVRDRDDGPEVASWDGYSQDDDMDDDAEGEDDDDDDETDAFGLGGRGNGGGGVKVLTFDAAGARTGSWSEDSSDEDEEQELWYDGLSDFDLEEDVLVGADGIGGIIPVDGEEMYTESFDLSALSSHQLSRPVDLGGGISSSSSRRTSAERKPSLVPDLEMEGDLAMAELLSGGVGDGEPGSMLIMEDWDGQLVFGPGSLDGSGGAFEFATESEGDSDGRKDADRMEDLWGEEEFLDEEYEGDEEGDTTDSLPDDEDDEMMLPEDLYPFPSATSSRAASATGVTADSPAAIFGLASPLDGDMPTPPIISVEPASPHPVPTSSRPQMGSFPSSSKVSTTLPASPRPNPNRIASLSGRSSLSKGPIMGSFLPAEAANPLRSVIIDGRSKPTETPSPFARRGSVRGRGVSGRGKSDGASARKRKGDASSKFSYPFSPAPTKRARYGAIPGPTHFSTSTHRRPPFREDTPSSPDLPATEPVSLEDVLDGSLLYHGTSDGSGGGGDAHRSLSRWDRIPIGTFRGRARGQASTHLIGSKARPVQSYPPGGAAGESIFRSGGGSRAAEQVVVPKMQLSPLIFARSESPSFGSGGELSRRGKRHEKKRMKRESGGGGSLKVPEFSLDG